VQKAAARFGMNRVRTGLDLTRFRRPLKPAVGGQRDLFG
jgi:hypothetical protein